MVVVISPIQDVSNLCSKDYPRLRSELFLSNGRSRITGRNHGTPARCLEELNFSSLAWALSCEKLVTQGVVTKVYLGECYIFGTQHLQNPKRRGAIPKACTTTFRDADALSSLSITPNCKSILLQVRSKFLAT